MKVTWGMALCAWVPLSALTLSLTLLVVAPVHTQTANVAGRTARAAAPFDPTGYWVSMISQDWRWRMVTPAKGDYAGVPITPAAKKVADAWDPQNDANAGNACLAYGAPGVMRLPVRLHITWQDDNTLKIETDNGGQTRLYHFGNSTPTAGAVSLQGESSARWAIARGNDGKFGSLEVTTRSLRPGYLRKNGVPYSGNAVLTEFWDLRASPTGDEWVAITASLDDPEYLREPWITSSHFKREPNGSKWAPEPCSAR